MAQRLIDIDRPQATQTRTELTLGRIGQQWNYKRRGELFVRALLDFLRSVATRDTLRSYSFSILQFFDWYQQQNGQIATPDEIRRADAVDFDRWLRTHKVDLTRWRLEHDPSRRIDLAIYEIVEGNPGANVDAIRDQLGRYSELVTYDRGERYLTIEHPQKGQPGGLAKRLACLVKVRTLRRTPSIEQLSRQAGRVVFYPPEEAFRYFVPEVAAEAGAERASTIATRLSALSSLWDYMIRAGENIAGMTEPLLRYNVWTEPLKLAQGQAPSHREVTRARKTPNLPFFLRLLATTFYRTHGRDGSYQAAEAAFWGNALPARVHNVEPSFKDLRDRALLLLMGQTGARSREVHLLKRRDVMGDPPVVTLVGKRGKKRSVALPPVVAGALREMDDKIRFIAEHQSRYAPTVRAERLLLPDAPLLPAVAYWGANAGQQEQGLTRPGISQMLHRRAVSAGMDPDGPDYDKAHPHGLRHMYIKLALESTPPHRVRAIVGHASLATTGRYAEERDPHMLIAESLRPRAAVLPAEMPPERAPLGAREPAWEPSREPIKAPAPPPRREPRPEPRLVRRVQAVERVAPPAPAAPPVVMRAPGARPAPRGRPPARLPAAPAPAADAFVQQIERYRKRPLTQNEEANLEKCRGVTNDVLRKLCVVYLVHWGEKGNRQELLSTGGGGASVEAKRIVEQVEQLIDEGDDETAHEVAGAFLQAHPSGRTASKLRSMLKRKGTERVEIIEEIFEPNIEEEQEELIEDEDEEEEWIEEEKEPEPIDVQAALAAISPEEKLAQIERVERGEVLFQMAGTNRLGRIYSGKDSGLSWWSGTNGKLKPEMPVMSPDQVGDCSVASKDAVCEGISDLWKELAAAEPTRAQALERWTFEALDVAAQMEDVVLSRGAHWVESLTAWPETKLLGTRRSPEPRAAFREHLPEEVVAWFRAVSSGYRVSPGDPVQWERKTAVPKVSGEPAPEWYRSTDPIAELALAERYELLDWITALTGGEPTDTEPRFAASENVRPASRADIAAFVTAMCSFDRTADRMREDPDVGPFKTAMLMKKVPLEQFPDKFRRSLMTAASEVSRAMSRATGGRVSDFDIKQLTAKRLSAKKAKLTTEEATQKRLSSWYLNLVRKYFGKEAARDSAIKLVALCGRVPMKEFAKLFRVDSGTIRHDRDFKREFAKRHGAHSECVARRIARELWEIKKRSPRSQYIEKPQHMVTLVKIMQSFKVPCSEEQERDLSYMLPTREEPERIYDTWSRFKERGVETEQQEGLPGQAQGIVYAEITPEERVKFVSNAYGSYRANPKAPALPTPIHLIAAVMS